MKSQNPGTFFLSLPITIIGSVIVSAFAVWLIVFKGQSGAGAGIVLIPILFTCLAAPIPGVIGQLIFAKYTNSLISSVIGIVLASLTLVVVYSTLIGTATIKENKHKKSAETEMVFFKSALEGKFKVDEIRDHYKSFNLFSEYEREAIKKLLYAQNRDKFSSQAIFVLIGLVTNDNLIVGYLADQPETSLEVKKKIAESLDEHAVLPMAINPETPQEILQMLAAHESIKVSGDVSVNKSSPPVVKSIYLIHRQYQYPDLVIHPSAISERMAWETLSRNQRAGARIWVASNKMAPVRILVEMANDKSENVLDWLILNSSTPQRVKQRIAGKRSSSIEEIISQLATSKEQRVRYGVAQSDVTSPEILAGLWKDSNDMVRIAIADNPKTPIETLKILSTNYDSKVKETATKALNGRDHKL